MCDSAVRRSLTVLGAVIFAFTVPSASPAAPQTASSFDLLAIDAHNHLQAGVRAEDLVHLMDLTGVARMVLMAQAGKRGGSDAQALEFAERFPGRFIPFVATLVPLMVDNRRWLVPDAKAMAFLNDVDAKLKSGKFAGIGEITVRRYDYFGAAEDHPADAPLMRKFADLAGSYRVPLLIHAEGEPAVVSAMERLLAAHADVRIIWAHNCGRQAAARVGEILARHPNLFCDLGAMNALHGVYGAGLGPRGEPLPGLSAIEDGQGHLLPEMKELFEANPDRFLGMGMDINSASAWQRYLDIATRFRELLSQLSPAIQRKFYFENAERVLNLPPIKQ